MPGFRAWGVAVRSAVLSWAHSQVSAEPVQNRAWHVTNPVYLLAELT